MCCHHYMTPPGKLHTVQMQELFLVEEHWHVFVVCVTGMHLDHYWHLYFMLWGADKVLGKVVPTLTEKALLWALSFSHNSRLYEQSQPSPSLLSSQADFNCFSFMRNGWKTKGCSVLGEAPSREEAETSGHGADVRPETTAEGEVWDLASLLCCSLGFI